MSPLVTSGGPAPSSHDGRHQPVVLVAEVGRQPAAVAERAGGGERPGAAGTPRLAGDDVGPRASADGPARPPARRPARTRAPGRRRRPPATTTTRSSRPRASSVGAHRCGVARGEDRLRQHEADPAAVGPGEAVRRGRGTRRRRRRTGPPPWRLDPPRVVAAASCDRYGGLPTTTSTRPCRAPQSCGEGVGARDAHRRCPSAAPAAAAAAGSMSTPTSRAPAAELGHAPPRGDEEPAVAACRVEHRPRRRPAASPASPSPTTSSTSHGGRRVVAALLARPRRRERIAAGARGERRVARVIEAESRFLTFDRDDWAALRAATPLTLREDDLDKLRGINERIDLDEVAAVYLPLSRLLNLYVSADAGPAQGVVDVPRHDGAARCRTSSASPAASPSARARSPASCRRCSPAGPTTRRSTWSPPTASCYPNAVLDERGLMDRKGFPESYDTRRLLAVPARVKSGADEVARAGLQPRRLRHRRRRGGRRPAARHPHPRGPQRAAGGDATKASSSATTSTSRSTSTPTRPTSRSGTCSAS